MICLPGSARCLPLPPSARSAAWPAGSSPRRGGGRYAGCWPARDCRGAGRMTGRTSSSPVPAGMPMTWAWRQPSWSWRCWPRPGSLGDRGHRDQAAHGETPGSAALAPHPRGGRRRLRRGRAQEAPSQRYLDHPAAQGRRRVRTAAGPHRQAGAGPRQRRPATLPGRARPARGLRRQPRRRDRAVREQMVNRSRDRGRPAGLRRRAGPQPHRPRRRADHPVPARLPGHDAGTPPPGTTPPTPKITAPAPPGTRPTASRPPRTWPPGRRVIIAARFKATRPDQPTPEEIRVIRLAWEDLAA